MLSTVNWLLKYELNKIQKLSDCMAWFFMVFQQHVLRPVIELKQIMRYDSHVNILVYFCVVYNRQHRLGYGGRIQGCRGRAPLNLAD